MLLRKKGGRHNTATCLWLSTARKAARIATSFYQSQHRRTPDDPLPAADTFAKYRINGLRLIRRGFKREASQNN